MPKEQDELSLGSAVRRDSICPPSTSDEPEFREFCICAAIQLDDGRVIRGHRHDDCIQTAIKWEKAGQQIGRLRQESQGFVTSRGRFVDREEGAALMRRIHWQSAWTGGQFESDMLFSEDLY
jgi:hypothetical protein